MKTQINGRNGSPNSQNGRSKSIQKKVCLLGDFAVGKTSLTRRFVEDKFDDTYLSTVGVKISRRLVLLNSITLELIIWDLAGGDDFAKIRTNYLRGVAGVLFVCDLTRLETLKTCYNYKQQIDEISQSSVPYVLLANKADLDDRRQISDRVLQDSPLSQPSSHFLTSAKTGLNVEAAFACLGKQLLAS